MRWRRWHRGNWKRFRLPINTKPGFTRIRTEVKDERVMSYLLDFTMHGGGVEWVPMSVIYQIGIDPNGYWYSVDLKDWFVKKKRL